MILDQNTIQHFRLLGAHQLKVFFYEAGCSGNKVDVTDQFDITDDLTQILSQDEQADTGLQIYVETQDRQKFEGARITRVVKADHTGKEQVRYIFAQSDVLDRCGCGTSFSFEAKKIQIDLEKLKNLKQQFGKK